ncbi:MAG: hypothetical protein AAFN77_19070 [Planctomycetota bacterium]
MDPTQTFLEALKKTRFSGRPDEALIRATNEYMEAREPGSPIPAELIGGLKSLPIQGASWLAILFGSAVEQGRDPMLTAPAMWDAFCHRLDQFPPTVNESVDLPEMNDRQEVLAEGMAPFCQGMVAHLARAPGLVQQISSDQAIRERIRFLQNYSHGFTWIDEILARDSGNVLLLHAESRRAVLMEYQNVGNCFHLFTLIQGAIGEKLPGGQVPNETLLAAARCEVELDEGDEAWWHYGSPNSTEPDMIASIFGEASVSSIPEIEGQKVMILWPKIMESRGWGAGFFGIPIEASPPNAQLQHELSPDEAEQWFKRLGL